MHCQTFAKMTSSGAFPAIVRAFMPNVVPKGPVILSFYMIHHGFVDFQSFCVLVDRTRKRHWFDRKVVRGDGGKIGIVGSFHGGWRRRMRGQPPAGPRIGTSGAAGAHGHFP